MSDERFSSFLAVLIVSFIGIVACCAFCCLCRFESIRMQHAASQPSTPSMSAGTPSEPASLQDAQRESELRTKVVQAIFPEIVVDSSSLHYDPEASALRWTNNKDADTTCSVCIEQFKKGDTVISSLCGHVFHRDCIVGWSQRKSDCPVCRQGMWDPKTYDFLEKEIKAGAGNYRS